MVLNLVDRSQAEVGRCHRVAKLRRQADDWLVEGPAGFPQHLTGPLGAIHGASVLQYPAGENCRFLEKARPPWATEPYCGDQPLRPRPAPRSAPSGRVGCPRIAARPRAPESAEPGA